MLRRGPIRRRNIGIPLLALAIYPITGALRVWPLARVIAPIKITIVIVPAAFAAIRAAINITLSPR